MDFYLVTFAVGLVGMIAMAFGGFARGRTGGHGRAGGHGHGAHAGHGSGLRLPSMKDGGNLMLTLTSPRVLFSFALGVGASGLVLRPMLGEGIVLAGTALALGLVFERTIFTPIWNFAFRFASNPALTLESAVMGDATAVTAFDANGQGLVAVEIDGRLVQVLGTLQSVDRELRVKVVAGSRLRVESVDAARNRCTVSLR
jgi:hypothetical protein